MSSAFNGLLVRMQAGVATSPGATLRATGVAFELEPLFPAVAGVGAAMAAGMGGEMWCIARPKGSLAGANPWEIAYAAAQAGAFGVAGVDYVEPDLLQDWPHAAPPAALAAAERTDGFDDQIKDLPWRPHEFAWHLDDGFSQLRAARNKAHAMGGGSTIRIAHIDTGYDPGHMTFPQERVEDALQRNFVDKDRPRDASDPRESGMMQNPGHGTGTLSILAGARLVFKNSDYAFDDILGGAPDARIVPIRAANSVVQMSTSSIAGAIGYVAGLCADESTRVHVISMSMGGVASAAWAEAVNRAYMAGIVFVAAAGNNFSAGFFGFPARSIVYPARFGRVIAACGAMADRRPYYGLSAGTMQGNWGPDSKMASAIAAFTPNAPWAQIGGSQIVDMNGQGTSSATPQVAAAAALYLQAHAQELFDRGKYPEDWMRVEAVRQALFATADRSADGGSHEKLGNGILQAAAAIDMAPMPASVLRQSKPDSASFSFLRVLSGLGAAPTAMDRMLQVEATQLAQTCRMKDRPNPLECAIRDPDRDESHIAPAEVKQFLEAILEHPQASKQLKQRAGEVRRSMFGGKAKGRAAVAPLAEAPAASVPIAPFEPPEPAFRSLRGFAFDPGVAARLDTAHIGEIRFKVPWERLSPGPCGEYLEVIDVDPGSGCFYEPVDLDARAILAQEGLAPSEGTPQFHQQMVYAVASLTIDNFEHALGRRALWRPGPPREGQSPKNDSNYVQRLRIYPHALREPNAYYSVPKIALLFGYFNATEDAKDHMPRGRVFACLSHDIIAHETTHALLDGMHRRYLLASNPDVRAFHEAFADIVALLQHFTFPEILEHQVASTRGEIRGHESLLGQLATQFGKSTRQGRALRDAIGQEVDGVWKPGEPDPAAYERLAEPHDRGAILVAAVFDAFLSIYERRTSDLLRLATGGSGLLQPGAIHPDLVRRLAEEAAKSAGHVLTMCIRALDYCPPTDITFGEYLRAIITADYELVRDDDLNYRVAFIEAFRRRGIYPRGVRTLSVESLLWRGSHNEAPRPSAKLLDMLEHVRDFATDHIYLRTREEVFHRQRAMRMELHDWLRGHFADGKQGTADAQFLGIDPERPFEVHAARVAYRVSPDGEVKPQVLVGILQEKQVPADPANPNGAKMSFEGGCNIVADLRSKQVLYCIRKNQDSDSRLQRQQAFAAATSDSSRSTYSGAEPLADEAEPFAVIHRGS